MCGSKPKDRSEDIAREQEDKKQAAIADGTRKVNDSFANFDDTYYGGVRQAHQDYYTPQLETQYEKARRGLITNLNAKGGMESSSANRAMADLAKENVIQQGMIADKALGAEQELRGNVEQNRSELIQQLEAGSGVSSVANAAMARAASLTAKPTYSPLADMFSQTLQGITRQQQLRAEGYGAPARPAQQQQQKTGGSVKEVV